MRKTALPLISLACILALGACKLTGGGYIASAEDPEAKATFAFTGECDNISDNPEIIILEFAKGNLQYNDHGTKDADMPVRLHGKITGTDAIGIIGPLDLCQQPQTILPEDSAFVYSGEYTAQPKKNGSGQFRIIVTDGGEPGISEGDHFEIELIGGPFDGYENEGFIQGGNIQYHG